MNTQTIDYLLGIGFDFCTTDEKLCLCMELPNDRIAYATDNCLEVFKKDTDRIRLVYSFIGLENISDLQIITICFSLEIITAKLFKEQYNFAQKLERTYQDAKKAKQQLISANKLTSESTVALAEQFYLPQSKEAV